MSLSKESFFFQWCQSKSGHLVEINDQTEADIIIDHQDSIGITSMVFWIGLNKKSSSTWEWMSGAPLDHPNWDESGRSGGYPEFPNDPAYSCAYTAPQYNLAWRDNKCSHTLNILCES